jgi:hypothetical protein
VVKPITELALGFAVTGRPRPGKLLRKAGLRPGDRLILTKPLGTGVILAAAARGLVPSRFVEAAIATMVQSAASAASCFLAHRAPACTDVTGFGLLGSGVGIDVPLTFPRYPCPLIGVMTNAFARMTAAFIDEDRGPPATRCWMDNPASRSWTSPGNSHKLARRQ